MKKFLIKIFLFQLPILLIFLPAVLVLKKSGENFTNINSVLKDNHNYLIGYAYNENNYDYLKWYRIKNNKKASVLALGSSRVLQFRANMFKYPFYNAGFTVSKISDFKPFLQSIPKEKHPEYLIIGLDQWMFNKNWDPEINYKRQISYWSTSFSKYPDIKTYYNVYKDLLNNKYNFKHIYNYSSIKKIGLNALINNKGFRNDGSLFYGTQISKLDNDESTEDYLFDDTFDRIKKGINLFEYGKSVSSTSINKLEELLTYCNQNNIKVIGFLPPFADMVNDKLSNNKNYEYIEKIYPKIFKIFTKYGYEFYNYSSLKGWNLKENEFLDGFHGGEVIYGRILLDMLNRKSILNNVSDFTKINNDIINRKNKFQLYNP